MRKITILPILLLMSLFSFAQSDWEGGLQIGYSNYVGDLTEPTFTFDGAGFATAVHLNRNFTTNLSARLNVLAGRLSGDDTRYSRLADRGNRFEGTFTEVSLLGQYELLGHKRYDEIDNFNRTFSPYLYLGVGVMFFNPDVTYGDLDNRDAQTDHPKSHFVVPFGVGLKIDLNKNLYLCTEWGVRKTASDNIDGVKLSGDASNNDAYFSGGISIGYRFGQKNQQLDIPGFEKN